jgi:hypothetical protein
MEGEEGGEGRGGRGEEEEEEVRRRRREGGGTEETEEGTGDGEEGEKVGDREEREDSLLEVDREGKEGERSWIGAGGAHSQINSQSMKRNGVSGVKSYTALWTLVTWIQIAPACNFLGNSSIE